MGGIDCPPPDRIDAINLEEYIVALQALQGESLQLCNFKEPSDMIGLNYAGS